VCINNYT